MDQVEDYPVSIHDHAVLPAKKHPITSKYPFGKLEANQMFLVECPEYDRRRLMRSISVAAHSWCKRRGIRNHFVCRTLPDGVGVYKVVMEVGDGNADD